MQFFFIALKLEANPKKLDFFYCKYSNKDIFWVDAKIIYELRLEELCEKKQ